MNPVISMYITEVGRALRISTLLGIRLKQQLSYRGMYYKYHDRFYHMGCVDIKQLVYWQYGNI